ncbi:MAG: hypothetical protein KDI46_07260 [Alphaproteobacteria bacterium]|nr:hypothetical protein [Alphaproteobacteria bacterium]
MKFVFFGYDFMLPSALRLIEDGHSLAAIFTFPCDNVFNFNTDCQTIAGRINIPLIQSPATPGHIEDFINQGCNAFIAAGYPHKIPPIDEEKAYAINVHPTYLPYARGLMPIPKIIMQNLGKAAGFTAHKMTQKFDAGDILIQHKFNLGPKETVETYTAKIALHAPDMISALFADLPKHWKEARPQNEKAAFTLPAPTDEERMLDWTKPVHDIDTVGRAFGRFGSIAHFDARLWVVYDYDVWQEKHKLTPGTVAARLSREIVIAAQNGFVCLKAFEATDITG